MKKTLYVDTETTGLNPQEHGLVQLAMIMDIDGIAVDIALFTIQPFPTDRVEVYWNDVRTINVREAEGFKLPIVGLDTSDLITRPTPFEAIDDIILFLDKYISKFDKTDKASISGYNIQYDIDFLSAFFKKVGNFYLGSYLYWQKLDVLHKIYQIAYKHNLVFENFKLATICNYFAIPITEHDALSDITATRNLWNLLEKRYGGV